MANQTGIAITIKAFLPTGKTLDEQFAALSIIKAAHGSGDYTELLKAAGVDEVKTEQKTRRVEEVVQQAAAAAPETNQDDTTREGANVHGLGPDGDGGTNPDYAQVGETVEPQPDEQTASDEAAPEPEPAKASRKKPA